MYLPFLMERNEVRMMLEISRKDFEEKSFTEVMEMAMDDCLVCTEDNLCLYVAESMNDREYNLASHLVEALRKYCADYYSYDRDMGTLEEPTPIVNKEDLIDYGYVEFID